MVKNCPYCNGSIHLLFDVGAVTFRCPSCGFSFTRRGDPVAAAEAWNDRIAGSAVSCALRRFKLSKSSNPSPLRSPQ